MLLRNEEKPEITEEQRTYVKAWMNILIDGRTSIHFLNRKRMEKKLKEYYADFQIWEKEDPNEMSEKWREFAKFWIETCIKDKNYSTTAFGMFPMKDDTLARKIADEINDVTLIIPDKIGIKDDLQDFRTVVTDTFISMIPEGRKYFS